MSLSIDDQIKALSRRCERILTEEDLRKKLEQNADAPSLIKTEVGIGYRLSAEGST